MQDAEMGELGQMGRRSLGRAVSDAGCKPRLLTCACACVCMLQAAECGCSRACSCTMCMCERAAAAEARSERSLVWGGGGGVGVGVGTHSEMLTVLGWCGCLQRRSLQRTQDLGGCEAGVEVGPSSGQLTPAGASEAWVMF
jgi:hypothetical protein